MEYWKLHFAYFVDQQFNMTLKHKLQSLKFKCITGIGMDKIPVFNLKFKIIINDLYSSNLFINYIVKSNMNIDIF